MSKKLLALLCAAMCTVMLCAGCSSQPSGTQAATTSEFQTVGTPATGAYEIKLTNALNDQIMSVVIVKTADIDTTPVVTNCTVNPSETFQFYYTPQEGATETDLYTAMVTTKKGRTFTFNGLMLGTLAEGTLSCEGELCYVTYTDKTGTTGSTKDLAQAELDAENEAADQAVTAATAEQAATTEATAATTEAPATTTAQ